MRVRREAVDLCGASYFGRGPTRVSAPPVTRFLIHAVDRRQSPAYHREVARQPTLNHPRVSLDELRLRLRPFLETRAVRKAIVFGSYARGTQTLRSDLDLALIVDTDKRFLERAEQVRGIEDLLPGVPMALDLCARRARGHCASAVHPQPARRGSRDL
jgi:predicted nucleotidyltransferase